MASISIMKFLFQFSLLTALVQAWIPQQSSPRMPHAVLVQESVSSSSSSEGSAAASSSLTAEEEEFFATTAQLCEERNLPLQKVKNCRDLATVQNSPVQPGRIIRMGRISDATDADIDLLLQKVNLTTLVDLRSPTELKDDPTLFRAAVFGNFTNLVWKEDGRGKEGCLKELKEGEGVIKKRPWSRNGKTVQEEDYEFDVEEESSELSTQPGRKERYFVSIMNEFKYVKGTVSKLRKRDITKAILKSPGALVSRRVRSSVKKPFLDEINDGGLPMLNELLLRFGAPGIRYVLTLCSDRQRHPIGFYCTAGKDRTGLIAAIILGLCGTKPEDIVEDYSLSAKVYAQMNDHQAMVGALSQRNLDAKTFLGAPPAVMRATLEAIHEEYGSVEGYCDWIGFGKEDQEALRKACLED
jgi:protein tyrosine/serine phosphatase